MSDCNTVGALFSWLNNNNDEVIQRVRILQSNRELKLNLAWITMKSGCALSLLGLPSAPFPLPQAVCVRTRHG